MKKKIIEFEYIKYELGVNFFKHSRGSLDFFSTQKRGCNFH